ncbi:MAG: hypothetical protein QOH87_4391, partial [Trebonia sp.]|nr:hypothetical protein [Trebonia sp.]
YTGTENIQAFRTSKIPSTSPKGPVQANAPGASRQPEVPAECLPGRAAFAVV